MSYWVSNHQYQPVMYAENCPEEPIILKEKAIEEQPSVQIIKHTPKSVRSNIKYRPHIITAKKWAQTSVKCFEEIQHERQLSILQNRIQNCKSLSQRKKDRNDPIIYPAYFIREKKRCKDARIDGYFHKVVEGNEKSKSLRLKESQQKINKVKSRSLVKQQVEQEEDYDWPVYEEKRFTKSNFPLPPMARQQISRRDKGNLLNLPESNTQSIVAYIVERKMFLEGDLKILKARLLHNYGKTVEKYWRQAIYFLLRHKPS